MLKNPLAWNKLISEQTKGGQGREALKLYYRMREEGTIPNNYTFVAVLKACTTIADLAAAKRIGSHVSECGQSNIFVTNTLLDMYVKCGGIEDAWHVFGKMRHPNLVSWNTMIIGYAQTEMAARALELYARMQKEGFEPDAHTFVAALKACARLAVQEENKGTDGLLIAHYLEQGRAIHADILKRGLEPNIFVSSTLVDMYAKCRRIEDARRVFENMKHKNIISWNIMIIGYAQRGMGNSALELYARMQDEGFTPNDRTFVAALKACASLAAQEQSKEADDKFRQTGSLKQGKTIHNEVARRGFESDRFVANTLLDMYAKCGSIEDACQVYEKMTRPDVASWNAMIAGYAQMGMCDLALELYTKMQSNGYTPDDRTFVVALKACASFTAQEECTKADNEYLRTRYLEHGRAIHAEIVRRGFESDAFVASTLVDMYAKCGSIEDAHQVFEKMRHRDIVPWNAMITGYVQMEMGDSALELFARMQKEGFTPDDRSFVAALKACASLAAQEEGKGANSEFGKARYLEQGRAIHAEVVKRGLESDIFIASTLVDMYAKCGSIEDARQVFERIRHQSVVSWTAMIIGYAQMEMGDLALELYTCMQNEGFAVDDRTFVAALKACASLAAQAEGKGADGEVLKARSLEQGRSIHAEVAKKGLESDIFVANSLLDMYAKCGSIEDACQVFEKMRHRDVVSWNAMIIGFAQMEMGVSALELYARMQNEGFPPDARTFAAVLKAYACLAAQEDKGDDVELLKTTYLQKGRSIHAEVAKRGFESSIFIASTLVDMYAKCGSIEEARKVFENMRCRDVVSWNSMIMGYVLMEMGDLALELFARMQHEGFPPDAYTFVAALQACGSVASLETGKEVHSQIQRVGLHGHSFIANGIIDMYGKCGSMSDAQQVFDSLCMRKTVTWNALIAGYSGQGDSEFLFNVYEKMEQEGIKPNGVTFVSVLNVCSHNGLVDKGKRYFQAMCLDHWIIPSRNHYACMTDLLGRAGQLDEAAAMAMRMPFEPDRVTWTTFLGACRKWNNAETGRKSFECVVMLDEKFATAYVLMTNIYVSSSFWEESARIEELRMKAKA